MLINLLCWLWIAVSAFAFGMAGLGILKRIDGYGRKELDEIVIFGVCLLTVYAQFFSLFCKVSGKATVLLTVLNIILIGGGVSQRHFADDFRMENKCGCKICDTGNNTFDNYIFELCVCSD